MESRDQEATRVGTDFGWGAVDGALGGKGDEDQKG
jgi:hypothetical protein